MPSRPIRLSTELIAHAKCIGAGQQRSIAAQIEYWARVGMAYAAGTGVSAPVLDQLPADPAPVAAKDRPPSEVAGFDRTYAAVSRLMSDWGERIVAFPRTEDISELVVLHRQPDHLLDAMHHRNQQSIEKAWAFAQKHQST